jgi:hypothetical protein
MLDFNHRETFNEALTKLVDASLVETKKKEAARNYLGASIIGNECDRAIQYDFAGAAKDEGGGFSGQTYRIFDRGHWGEAYMAELLKGAGFDLRTLKTNGQQFGFSDLDGRFAGHIDGAIVGVPAEFPLKPTVDNPSLWENKVLGAKSWKDVAKNKLAKARPGYHVQMQVYQGYMGYTTTPGLFTALNADTMEIYAELIPFDAVVAQAAIDKAVRIITATEHGELLPRIAQDQDFFICKMCAFKKRCWGLNG